MDLRTEILHAQTKAQALRIVNWIETDEQKLAQVIDLFLNDTYRVIQHAAWIINLVAERHPQLVYPYLERMIVKMKEPGLPPAVRRNVVRILDGINIPEKLHGLVMENCFAFLQDPNEAVAVRVFSMSVLNALSVHYPEIKQELLLTIEEGLSQKPSAAYRARAKAVLKKLSPRKIIQ